MKVLALNLHCKFSRVRSNWKESVWYVLKKFLSYLDSEVTISRAAISERGYPVISLSTEASYTFNADLGVWWENKFVINIPYFQSLSSMYLYYLILVLLHRWLLKILNADWLRLRWLLHDNHLMRFFRMAACRFVHFYVLNFAFVNFLLQVLM